ncbi:MAG: non-canonical purine NTP pyrophosphatase, partial [Alphaproteobacteria bacterium]|nr:non-canonical purine NTP pyrophosphatase [Alphaproteobacteria bacterium]
MQGRLVVATHNKGKVKEFGALLAPYWQSFVSAAELNLPEPEETGQTFADNALLKARAAAGAGYWTLADDSGLCVNALGGDPGLYSARWAGPQKDFQMAMRRVHDGLANTNDRSAYFICVLALIDPDGREHVFEGRCEGAMTWPPRGSLGFGYDP